MYRTILIIVLSLSLPNVQAQGCSDAGACSVGLDPFSEAGTEGFSKVQVSVEQTFGLGEKWVFIGQTTAGIKYQLFSKTAVEMRVPFIFTIGNLGSSAGVGDMMLSVTQTVFAGLKQGITIVAGTRLKSNNADFKFDRKPLPMAYQTSLGSNDIIAGIFYYYNLWDFYLAWQHPFNRNNNQYLHPVGETNDHKLYYESAYLKRGDDMFVRVQRLFRLQNQNSIKVTMLAIYRLQEDQIIKDDENIHLDGSKGITINLGITCNQKLKSGKSLEYALSFPVIDRKYRADGLTRNLVLRIKVGL